MLFQLLLAVASPGGTSVRFVEPPRSGLSSFRMLSSRMLLLLLVDDIIFLSLNSGKEETNTVIIRYNLQYSITSY